MALAMAYAIGEDLSDSNPIETMQSLASYYLRTSTQLTEKILRSIANSVQIFRPSQSLAVLSEEGSQSPTNTSDSSSVAEIDVVISGGGLKFYHVMGSIAVLQKQFQQNKIRIARVAGASAGAWAALFVIVQIPLELILESYHQCAENPRRYLHDVYTESLVGLLQSCQQKCSHFPLLILSGPLLSNTCPTMPTSSVRIASSSPSR
jgi:hypothetical protein